MTDRRLWKSVKSLASIAHYRLARPALPPKRFVLFGRGRSGTTALVSLMDSLPHVHCDGEVLNPQPPFPYHHVIARCARSKQQVYGCKILSYQLIHSGRHEILNSLYADGFNFIYVRRENTLKHIVSNIRARSFGFHRRGSGAPESNKIRLHPREVIDWIERSEGLGRYEARLLEGIPHLSLTYERHIENPDTHQDCVDAVCSYLGIETQEARTDYRKVSPRELSESIENYQELADSLIVAGYERYLE